MIVCYNLFMRNFIAKQAWQFYTGWRKESTYSPALRSVITVSLMGWDHITARTGYRKRPKAEIQRRLELLPHAREIILAATTFQDVVIRGSKIFYALEAVVPIKLDLNLIRSIHKVIVRIIVLEQDNNKIFYSIMEVNKKWNASRFSR